MPLDEFKTQVLILHSEQSTLDNLSSGFGDRYTVHCASSGSEALNTLVETPINVIITAHDLPGMSGLDALREAKKRSPDTIGILLAGNSTTDIQALVGDEEVFQVVSGNITSDGLLQLVDSATRQMRLMALAESANDTMANVDAPAEHIIMETSENGSTIISDGTGRMPVLDPKKISAAVNVGSRAVDVLVLTKDQEFLETIKDSSRGMHKVYYANTLGQANEAIRKHKIGVAVVDAAMVGEKIEQLSQHLRKGSPRLVSIVAGRRDDGEMLMDLINRGKVYRFLLKPVSPGRARLAVEASVKHHLEAPDAAFKTNGVPPAIKPQSKKPAAAPPAPKPVPNIAAKPVAKPAAVPTPQPKPAAVAPAAVAPAAPAPNDPPLGSAFGTGGTSPIEDGLADAFGQDDTSFTETVTGLISSLGEKFSSDKRSEMLPEKPLSSDSSAVATAGSGGSILKNPKVMGIGAACVVVLAVAVFWFIGGDDEPVIPAEETLGTPAFAEADVVFEAEPTVADAVDGAALLKEARLARDAGQLFNPAGNNAIELFAAAMTGDPDNSLIAAELDAAIGQALSMAESAMLASRLDDASAALQRVGTVDSQNSRLPFLNAQLAQMQLRSRLDEARAAIREVRFEDAAIALGSARSLDVPDSAEIDAVSAELSTARSEQQVDDVLAKAADRLEAGNLLSPSNDNARYYYELVLSNDAENVAARQGLNVIAGKLAFQARTEIDDGQLNVAEDTLATARSLDPNNNEVAAAANALEERRAANADQQQRAAAERRAEAERRAAALRQEEADRQAAVELQAETERQAEADRLAAASTLLEGAAVAGTVDASIDTDIAAENNTMVETSDTESDESTNVVTYPAGTENSNAANTEQAADEQSQLEAPAIAEPVIERRPVAVSSLNRVKYVAPKYPRTAQRRNISGWVDVVFTVAIDGSVQDVNVPNSEPGTTFVKSAVNAVEKWQFEPVFDNGVIVERRAGVRMMFALE